MTIEAQSHHSIYHKLGGWYIGYRGPKEKDVYVYMHPWLLYTLMIVHWNPWGMGEGARLEHMQVKEVTGKSWRECSFHDVDIAIH